MATVIQMISRLQSVGGPKSKVIVWADLLCRSPETKGICVGGEGDVVLHLTPNHCVRDDLLAALEHVNLMAQVIMWISGCRRTIGVVSYDELDDTITIGTQVV